MIKTKYKILLWDIETTPNRGWVWGKWEQNVIGFTDYSYFLTIAYKFVGDKEVKALSLPMYKHHRNAFYREKAMLEEFSKIVEGADILVAHNGDSFDIKKLNTRLVKHGLKPLPPFKTIDTKKWAKSVLNVPSNSLNDLSDYFGLGKKAETGGFDLWLGCMNDDKQSWQKMVKYNKQDIVLLEALLELLWPWVKDLPVMKMAKKMLNWERQCTNESCLSRHVQSRGQKHYTDGVYQQYQCMECGRWFYVLV